jgi:hypothetical protein
MLACKPTVSQTSTELTSINDVTALVDPILTFYSKGSLLVAASLQLNSIADPTKAPLKSASRATSSAPEATHSDE